MKWTVGLKIGAGFGIALAILVAIGAVAYRSTVVLTETAAAVAHTHKVLERVEALVSSMKDAETGQRGFIITGDASYLEPFRASRDEMNAHYQALRGLTADNPNQQRRLDTRHVVVSPDGDLPGPPTLKGFEVTPRPNGAFAVSYKKGQSSVEQVLAAVRAAGVTIADISTEDPDLEDVFLALTYGDASQVSPTRD